MPYHEDPKLRGYWFYDGLRIQADVETHQFATAFAKRSCPPGAAVLDVAAGEGALAKQLLDAGLCPSCTTWNDKVKVDAPQFRVDLDHPFGPEAVGSRTYDLVCAIEIIEHVENPAAFLRSCASVLAPGGWMLLSTPNVECASVRLQWLLHGSPRIFSADEVEHNRHISMAWRHGLEFLIQASGLQIVEKHLLGQPHLHPGPISLAKRLLYRTMEAILPGDTKGTTRFYVLKAADRAHKRHGPADVY